MSFAFYAISLSRLLFVIFSALMADLKARIKITRKFPLALFTADFKFTSKLLKTFLG